MRTARTACTLALLLAVASPALAATGAKRTATPKNTVAYYTTIDRTLRPVTLTDDQKSKLDALKKDYEQKFKDAYAKEDSMLSPEQKKAGDDARKAATADGKTRREINQAVTDALKLTDQQKAQKKDAAAALRALQQEFREKALGLLTDAQKQQITTAAPKKAAKPSDTASK